MAAPEGYNALGKIGISYKGDYDSNTTYERLDAVEHNGSTYLAIKDAPDGAPRDDKLNWIYLAKGFSGDIGDSEIAFTEAENRENINTGESVKTVFGKIKKFFADLTAPAFAQMITSKDDLLATKATGYVPDAKAVADAVSEVNGKLSLYTYGDKVYGSSSTAISPVSWAAQWISIIVPDGYSFFTAICCSNNDVVCGVSAANYDNDNSRVLVNAYNRHTQARDFSHVYIVPIFIRD